MSEKNGDKKKQDFLKAIFNVKQYTKNLKKNASNLQQDNFAATYSYDQIQTYSVIPNSVKQSSTTTFIPKDLYASTNFLFDNSQSGYKKYKNKKSNNQDLMKDMTQSSGQIMHTKIKKSSYSQLEKSQGGIKLIKKQKDTLKLKQKDVQSQYKQKNFNSILQEPLSINQKTQSLSKIIHKKSFQNSNINDYQSEKLSLNQQAIHHAYRKNSTFYQNRKIISQKKPQRLQNLQNQTQYNLSSKNFLYLIKKIQELENIIVLHQESIIELKNKIINLQQNNKQSAMLQIFTDSLKEQLMQEKNKNAQLKQKLFYHENYMKQHNKILFQSIQKIAKFYQKQVTEVISLRKQNSFLKFLLQLENTQNLQKKLQKYQNKSIINTKFDQKIEFQFNLSKDIQQLKTKNQLNLHKNPLK